MMKAAYLEVTFRRGRPLAAYYHLPRQAGQKSVRTVRLESGLLADLDQQGRPIGIEITAPGSASEAALNRVLLQFGLPALGREDLRPLRAA
jgi:uncharacterized protein YuzE